MHKPVVRDPLGPLSCVSRRRCRRAYDMTPGPQRRRRPGPPRVVLAQARCMAVVLPLLLSCCGGATASVDTSWISTVAERAVGSGSRCGEVEVASACYRSSHRCGFCGEAGDKTTNRTVECRSVHELGGTTCTLGASCEGDVPVVISPDQMLALQRQDAHAYFLGGGWSWVRIGVACAVTVVAWVVLTSRRTVGPKRLQGEPLPVVCLVGILVLFGLAIPSVVGNLPALPWSAVRGYSTCGGFQLCKGDIASKSAERYCEKVFPHKWWFPVGAALSNTLLYAGAIFAGGCVLAVVVVFAGTVISGHSKSQSFLPPHLAVLSIVSGAVVLGPSLDVLCLAMSLLVVFCGVPLLILGLLLSAAFVLCVPLAGVFSGVWLLAARLRKSLCGRPLAIAHLNRAKPMMHKIAALVIICVVLLKLFKYATAQTMRFRWSDSLLVLAWMQAGYRSWVYVDAIGRPRATSSTDGTSWEVAEGWMMESLHSALRNAVCTWFCRRQPESGCACWSVGGAWLVFVLKLMPLVAGVFSTTLGVRGAVLVAWLDLYFDCDNYVREQSVRHNRSRPTWTDSVPRAWIVQPTFWLLSAAALVTIVLYDPRQFIAVLSGLALAVAPLLFARWHQYSGVPPPLLSAIPSLSTPMSAVEPSDDEAPTVTDPDGAQGTGVHWQHRSIVQ